MGGVLCSGSIIHDTLVHPAGEAAWGTTTFVQTIQPFPGGNGANTSLALAKAGGRVRLLGVVGEDEPGRFLIGELQRAGVDTAGVRVVSGATAATIVLVNHNGERRFLHRMGVSSEAFGEGIDFAGAVAEGMAHYHLSSLFILPRLRPLAPGILAAARAAGLTTSLDTNWDPQGRWMRDIGPCLPHLDLVFMNEDEARMCTGHGDPRPAAEVLLRGGASTVVLKLGARGCAIYTGDRELLVAGFPVEVLDTTGAGDSFVGGFLCAWQQGAPLAEAGRFGNALGAMVVQHVGGAAGLEDGLDVAGWIAQRG